MPWNAGVYTRTNGQFNGETIWDTDKANSIKIESARHDTHDQDLANGISACLNINGQNSMNVNLNMGSHKLVNVADGTANADGVNFGQMTTGLGLKLNSSAAITAQAWSGNTFTSTRADGNFTTAIKMFDEFKSNGPIRHKLLGSTTVDVSAGNRTRVDNNSGITISFTNVPSGADSDLPGDYEAEGNVIVWNGTSTSAPTVSTGNLGTVRTIGAPVATGNAAQVLTYFMCWDGSLKTTLIWSAL